MERQPATMLCIPLFTLVVALFLFVGCTKKSTEPSPAERGKYLAMAGGCGDCHSPKAFTAAGPVPNTARLLSGYPSGAKLPEIPKGILGPTQWGAITTNDMTAWVGPWGVSFSYNLTPDPATGIGNWNEAFFIQTLRTGKFMGTSRDMLPPMPWQEIGKMTDDDLKAIFAYLRSLPPIGNEIPAPLPPSQQ
jgi:mono/diheme cytochrome c family protein